ncbi:IgGFc-binding protein-like [Pseudophryne corroboree]|uniref:IgGFc-binding protein-like n=1 Tax=Pseudophryne corroboree TaxID=495146 RepID=UPI0030813244
MGKLPALLLSVLLVVLCGTCSAGPLGKNFVTVFMQNYKLSYSTGTFKLFITGYNPSTTVTVWMNKSSFKQVLNLNDRATLTVQIPENAELSGVGKSSNVIVIQADKEISVLSLNYKLKSADTSIVYPAEDLGSDYYVVTPLGGPDDGFKEFSVVSNEEATNVDVYLTGAVVYQEKLYPAGANLTVLLEPYNALQLLSRDDLSGTRVISQKPVAVLSGHTCTWNNTRCNHVYEQLRPVSSWGTTFIIPPIFLQTKPDIVYVVAAQNTKISYQINAVRSTLDLSTGQVIQLTIPVNVSIYLSASAGVQVIYYCTGWMDKNLTQYDPLLMTIPPVSSYCSSYYIYGQQDFDNYGLIVAMTTDISKIHINKSLVQGLSWKNITGTDYSWAAQGLGKNFSFQLVENPSSPFMLLSYGFISLNSYGSPAICINGTVSPSCSTIKCRARETCKMSNGKPVCSPYSEAYCHAVGDPHYRTFDGRYYDFQGTCSYTVAKTCGNDSGLPTFNIEAKNKNRGNTRVSYIGYVAIQVYENTVSVVRGEYGFVRLNNQRQALPLSLNSGQVRLYQSGGFLVLETDFSLKVYYDWNSILKIQISTSLSGSVCGLCGNYNGNPSDDLMKPDGTRAPNMIEFGKSWEVLDGDRFCWHNCNGECKTCPLETQLKYSSEESCGLLSKALDGPFQQCQSVIDPRPYLDNCVYDQCMNGGSKQILCQSLKTYVDACQRSNVQIAEWRQVSGCPMQCPENSQYKLCAQACPLTCNDDAVPSVCSDTCVETCQCKDGYVLDGGKCIPKANCGCIYLGKLYAANERFWGDSKCEKQCSCNPVTKKVECTSTRCKSSEKCSVVSGLQDCYPVSYGTCSASGDPHYFTFDGVRYNFQGTCIYQFAGLCNKSEDLIDFQVNTQNDNRGIGVVSYISAVQVKIYSFDVVVRRQFKDRILLNGILTNLPFIVDNGKLSIYRQGDTAIVQSNFGLRVSYNWDSRVAVTVPGGYAGAMCGLCGNFDGDQSNDFLMKNNQLTTKPSDFGNSWKVQNVSGCYEDDKAECPNLAELELHHINNKQGCGIITDKNGPFRDCHAKINPQGYFKSCVYDACFYKGRQDVLCKIIASYAVLCQEAGVSIYPWRTNKFCSPNCPKNSHYELCASGCAPTCLSLSSPLGCNPTCFEGCECDDDFLLSGGDCVPISQCGCSYNDKYYKSWEIFFSSELCNQQCICTVSGVVQCKAFTCGLNEECKVIDGVQKCQPVGSAQCSAAGDPHYISLDGLAFDFQGTCTYILAKTITNKENLVPFAITVKNEKWGNGKVSVTRLVSLEVYGYNLVLAYNVQGRIKINGVYGNLPLNLEDGKIQAYQNGIGVIIDTDFGVQVNYDLVYHVMVTVPGNYKEQLGGLCGNYNGNKNDDFQLPNKSLTTYATIFGASWKVPIPGVTCDNGCGGSGYACASCNDQKVGIFKSEVYCGFLKKAGGPLSACYATINPDLYFNNCVYDLCAGDGSILCYSIQSYVAACQEAGVTIQPWRMDSFCPMSCPVNSHYALCTRTCLQTCSGITEPMRCTDRCFEGCECDAGYLLDGDQCVTMDKCGCVFGGRYLSEGESFVNEDCSLQCKCQAGGVTCTAVSCTSKQRCGLVSGVRGCYKVDGECSVNPQKLVTFDGLSGATIANGLLEVASLCNMDASEWFRVLADIQSCGQAPSVSRIHIFLRGGLVTISKNKEVWVNGRLASLPTLFAIVSANTGDSAVITQIGTDLKIELSNSGKLLIQVSEGLSEAVCGVCGNFNGDASDDLRAPGGKVVNDLLQLVASWRAHDFNSCNA